MLALLAPLAAHAATDAAWQPLEQIREVAVAAVRGQAAADAQVRADPLDERLRLPLCAGDPQATLPAATGRAQVSVAVHCDGPVAWTLYVPVHIADLKPVLVARRALARGETLDDAAVTLETRDTAALPSGWVGSVEAARSQRLKRPLAAGAVITPDALEAPLAVRRGERVTLLGRVGALEVRAEGRALGEASVGQHISVENLSSRRVVDGVVVDGGTVEVRL